MILYKNNETKTDCIENVTDTTSVCKEALDIRINSSCEINNVTIAVNKNDQAFLGMEKARLWLCEVQIFTGTKFIPDLIKTSHHCCFYLNIDPTKVKDFC